VPLNLRIIILFTSKHLILLYQVLNFKIYLIYSNFATLKNLFSVFSVYL